MPMKRGLTCVALVLALPVGCASTDGGASLERLEFVYRDADSDFAWDLMEACVGAPNRTWAIFNGADGSLLMSGSCDDPMLWGDP